MTEVQPMKMAAAEALYDHRERRPPFSVFTIGTLDGSREVFAAHRSPACCPSSAPATSTATVQGINDLQAAVRQPSTAPATYTPDHPGHLLDVPPDDRLRARRRRASPLLVLWPTRKGRTPHRPAGCYCAGLIAARCCRCSQLLRLDLHRDGPPALDRLRRDATATGVSRSVSPAEVLTSLIVFTLLYGVLAVVEVKLCSCTTSAPALTRGHPPTPDRRPTTPTRPLAFAY